MDLEDINTIAVLGAGNMGHGIAEVAALAGYDVTMRDIEEDLVQDGYDEIEWSLEKLVEKDRITDSEADAALERVTPLVDVESAVEDADIVIEAVPERMDIKSSVYDEVQRYVPAEAVFASNTSSLSITDLSEATDRPEQFCGMHFFNPPVRMQLVEVIAGAHTADWVLDLIEDLAEDLGKTPVRVRKDSPGFIVNRIAVPFMNEVAWLVTEGEATIAEIDSTTKFDMGLPMGAFELADYVGLDVSYDVLDYLHAELGDAYEPAPVLTEKVDAGDLGRKSGAGFYDYEDGGVEIPPDAGRDEIAARLLAVMANEVAKLVGEDVADPDEIDEAVMLGLGYPDGPAKMADEHGLAPLISVLSEAHTATDHPRYAVADHLRTAAEHGGFHAAEQGDSRSVDGQPGEADGHPDFETITIERPGDGVGKLVLDRPHRMNSISEELLDELGAAIDALEADESVRSVLLVGAGDRAFSAGADVQSMAAGGGDGLAAIELSRKGQRVFGRLEETPMPVVAAIDGFCLGGGMELATCADLRLATERSELGQPEHDLGLLPGWGGTQRLRHIVGEGRAKEIIFTADRYDASELADYGFINEIVSPDAFEERAQELAAQMAAGPPIAQKFTKRAMLAGRDDTDAGLEVESAAFGHLLETDDVIEGVTAFMEDRDPEFEGQ